MTERCVCGDGFQDVAVIWARLCRRVSTRRCFVTPDCASGGTEQRGEDEKIIISGVGGKQAGF